MATQTTNYGLTKPSADDFYDINVQNTNSDIIDGKLKVFEDGKVDKVSGKGLSTNDFTTAEKNKLSTISSGAEVNQNTFSNVKVGTTTIAADSKTDTLELVAGSNVTLTPDATNDKITIAASVPVSSVNGKTGAINLNASDVGAETPAGAQAKADATQVAKLTQDSGAILQRPGDLDALFTQGFYYYSSSADSNGPVQTNAVVEVYRYNSNTAMQFFTVMATSASNMRRFVRYSSSGTWGVWIELETSNGAQAKSDTAEKNAIDFAKSFGIGTNVKYLQNGNANALFETGFYYINGSGSLNTPTPGTGGYYIINMYYQSTYVFQFAIKYDTEVIYTRRLSGGSWSSWTALETTDGAQTKVDTHANNKNNPHAVTKAQVGLGSVLNYGIATQAEAEVGALDTRYMTPLKTLQVLNNYGLGGFSKTVINPDLNTIQTNGFYYMSGTKTNAPMSTNGYLLVESYSSSYTKQTYTAVSTGETYIRVMFGSGNWTAWDKVAQNSSTQVHRLTEDDGMSKQFGGDVDALMTPGIYYLNGNATNRPNGSTGLCIVTKLVSTNGYHQIFYGTSFAMFRYYTGGAWNSWKQVMLDTDLGEYREGFGGYNYGLTLLNGVGIYSDGYAPVYRKTGKFVEVMGAVKSITSAETIIGTLPSGYRPAMNLSFAFPTTTVSNKARFARWSVNANGNIVLNATSDGLYDVASPTFFPFHFIFTTDGLPVG